MLNPRIPEVLGAAAVAAVAACTLTYAALGPGSQLFGRTLIAGRNPKEVALTYDDGPNDTNTDRLLDILARHEARATFFMIGSFVRQRPDIVRRVHAAGHLIGNHTDTHPLLSFQSPRVIREELRACNQALEDTLGAPVRYLRPPHGARRPTVFHIASELGLKLVQWNVMGHDWAPIGPAKIIAHIDHGLHRAERRHTGANILLHDGSQHGIGVDRTDTLTVTAQLLNRFAQQGLRAVTVDAWD
jgi:peptidoglycan-N-acetylglucosamine deacetylase